ncbi:MAG: UDP-N-acetylmuramoyl-L-alanyl-D-glutamate--2,6-diaminopimelate ligase [Bacteroidetes bacterium]|nr:UDP-N-acetylmuramoyl-L-alanyl-D-glutamate--2,6-diaminopimelate ligase [Bacteroidota bacterium]
MKLLQDILYKSPMEAVHGDTSIRIADIAVNSADAGIDKLYVAIKGYSVDGHHFIDDAIAKGCHAIVCEDMPTTLVPGITYVKVKDSRAAFAYISCAWFDNPSEKLKLIGVTGTNGKTTSVTLLYNLFTDAGFDCGLISTIHVRIGSELLEATHTTPDAYHLNQLLFRMANNGVTHCFMEVSSHAVVQQRIACICFSGALFTNITHDHLDFHKTFAAYIEAKKGFFDALPADAFAITNMDDRNGMVMLQNCKARKLTYSLKSDSRYKCRIVESNFNSLILSLDGIETICKLIGSFNAYNITGVYAVAIELGMEPLQALTILSNLNPPEGRFQSFTTAQGITGIVDYAHTPDALENVLKTINNIAEGNEHIITIIGCGGNRDATKRPVMARIACELSGRVILTSDNPRNEVPEDIIKQMEEGVSLSMRKKTLCLTDRREAIKAACSHAKKGDIILLAGKGHEKYQEINGVKYPFDDFEILNLTLQLFQN